MPNIRPAAILLLFLIAITLAAHAKACPVCFPVPRQTAADLLLEAATVVQAREDSERPYFFTPVKVLKGAVEAGHIDLFMNSTTRRLLTTNPGRAAVLVRKEPGAPWRGLGIPDEEYETIIKHVLAEGPHWQRAGRSRERVEFFAALLGHKNRQIHELAYLEVARAPYDWIRDLEISWAVEDIRALLRDLWYIEWQPLAILLLAQHGNDRDRKYLAESFVSNSKYGFQLNLAAYATVYIEQKQEAAIPFIQDNYFAKPSRESEELSAILRAVDTLCSVTHAHLRGRFAESFAVLLETHPYMAGEVAPMLAAWRRWELTGILQKIARDRPDDPGILQVRLYLSQAPNTDGH
jgi:hypothetical protein